MLELIHFIRETLIEQADERIASQSDRFFKAGESAKVYGVAKPFIKNLAKEVYQEIKTWSKADIYAFIEELWRSGYYEEIYIGCILCTKISKQYHAEDLTIFRNWMNKFVHHWAACDNLCCTIIGPFLVKFPEKRFELQTWTSASNRWMRRAAAVSLVYPAKRGLFLGEVFEIADRLLRDSDDMVQKGYGWMLKEASKAHQEAIFKYVMNHKHLMPRTALRYAIEKMPDDLRAEAMKKH